MSPLKEDDYDPHFDERRTAAAATAGASPPTSSTRPHESSNDDPSSRRLTCACCCPCRTCRNPHGDPPATSSSLCCWDNPEAVAWCLDVTGRTTAVLSLGAFFMPALLQLARIDAGCQPLDRTCSNPTSYGIKPGSWLTATQTIVSVLASPLLPVMGSVVDYTSHRRAVGRTLSALFCALLLPLVFVSSATWFALSILVVLIFLTFEFQMVMAYSYLPELAVDRNEDDLRTYTRNFTVLSFAFVVLYVATLVGITAGLKIATDAVLVAQIAMSATFAITTLMLGTAWLRGFKSRPPLHMIRNSSDAASEMPPSVWTAGFHKLERSIRLLAVTPTYRPLLWFNVAVAFSDASLQSLPTILITFFTDQLGFSSADIGVSVLILLLSIAPAGLASAYTTKKLQNNAVASSLIALLILIVTTTVAAIILTPEKESTGTSTDSTGKVKAYVLVVFWGLGNGWKWTCDRMASAALCPPQQSGEFMGLYLFSTIVLTWLPPLVFTVLNEAGVSMQVGLATLNAWFLMSFVAYLLVGQYRVAVNAIETFQDVPAVTDAEGPIQEEDGSCSDGSGSGHDESALNPSIGAG